MGRATTFDHKNTPHRAISMPPHRSAAIRRAAQSQGISAHVWIQRAISAGLYLAGETDNTEELNLCRTHLLNISPSDTATPTTTLAIASGGQTVCGRTTRRIAASAATPSVRVSRVNGRFGITLAVLSSAPRLS